MNLATQMSSAESNYNPELLLSEGWLYNKNIQTPSNYVSEKQSSIVSAGFCNEYIDREGLVLMNDLIMPGLEEGSEAEADAEAADEEMLAFSTIYHYSHDQSINHKHVIASEDEYATERSLITSSNHHQSCLNDPLNNHNNIPMNDQIQCSHVSTDDYMTNYKNQVNDPGPMMNEYQNISAAANLINDGVSMDSSLMSSYNDHNIAFNDNLGSNNHSSFNDQMIAGNVIRLTRSSSLISSISNTTSTTVPITTTTSKHKNTIIIHKKGCITKGQWTPDEDR